MIIPLRSSFYLNFPHTFKILDSCKELLIVFILNDHLDEILKININFYLIFSGSFVRMVAFS